MSNEVDANKVIEYLSNQVATMSKELAMVQAKMDGLLDVNEKQQDLIDAYEDKENAQK